MVDKVATLCLSPTHGVILHLRSGPRRDGCWCSAHFLYLSQSEIPAQRLVPPTFGVGLPGSLRDTPREVFSRWFQICHIDNLDKPFQAFGARLPLRCSVGVLSMDYLPGLALIVPHPRAPLPPRHFPLEPYSLPVSPCLLVERVGLSLRTWNRIRT